MKYYVEITFTDGTIHNVFATNYWCARDIRNAFEFKDGVRGVYIGDVKPIYRGVDLYERDSRVVNGLDIYGFYPKS